MIFYKDNIAYIRCECQVHGIEISNIGDEEINISLYTDNFYSKQNSFFKKWKDKLTKIYYILIGKSYRIDNDIILSINDLDELIEVLNKIKEER
jgi:predicted N-acyltransferase